MDQIASSSDEPSQPAVPLTAAPPAAAAPRTFRVSHSSGETLCADLATARLLLSQKPGARIFLQRG